MSEEEEESCDSYTSCRAPVLHEPLSFPPHSPNEFVKLKRIVCPSKVKQSFKSNLPTSLETHPSFQINCKLRFRDRDNDISANIFASEDLVIKTAVDKAALYIENLQFPANSGLSVEGAEAILLKCHQKFSKGGWQSVSEQSSHIAYTLDMDLGMRLRSRFMNRLKELNFDIPQLADEIQKERKKSKGFSIERCKAAFGGDPVNGIPPNDNFNLLLDIATNGFDLPIPLHSTHKDPVTEHVLPDEFQQVFRRNGENPPRMRQAQLDSLFHAHFVSHYELAFGNQVLILDASEIPSEVMRTIHFCSPHPVVKDDSPPTHLRMCLDMKHDGEGMNVNTDLSQQQATDKYGKCVYPTMQSMVQEWYDWCEREELNIKECVLFQCDITNAHGQLYCNKERVCLQAVELSRDPINLLKAKEFALYLVGTFGPVVLPYAFRVLGLAIKEAVIKNPSYYGTLSVYCDDSTALTTRKHSVEAERIVHRKIKQSLGDTAISEKKTIHPSSRIEKVLGMTVDLPSESFRPKQGSLEKAMYCFFIIGSLEELTLRQFQVLHGVAENLSRHMNYMRPYVACLSTPEMEQATARFKGKDKSNFRFKPNSSQKFAIDIWQIMSIIFCRSPDLFRLPLRSLLRGNNLPDLVIRTDGGPGKLGARVTNGVTREVIYWTQVTLPWEHDADNESHQNMREYAGRILALLLAADFFVKSDRRTYLWETDSATAQSWARNDKVKSLNTSAGMFFQAATTLISARTGVQLHSTAWLSTEEMAEVDQLSRIDYDRDSPIEGVGDFQAHRVKEAWIPLFQLLDPHLYGRSDTLVSKHGHLLVVGRIINSLFKDRSFSF
jgi:hypothetical protein